MLRQAERGKEVEAKEDVHRRVIPGSPKITTEDTAAIVLAGSSAAALCRTWQPCEYAPITTFVLGHFE
jgi:hypothetical protein